MLRKQSIFWVLIVAAFVSSACDAGSPAEHENRSNSQAHTTASTKRFYEIDDELAKALSRNDKEAAIRLANEYLTLADSYKGNWNYGNAIHDANQALGIVALRENDLEKAGQYLAKAGKTPGSPQLNSFGPDLTLADGLLKKGQKDVVLAYLRSISRFWDPGENNQCLPGLMTRIERGEQPKLNRFLLLNECHDFAHQ